MLNEHIAASGIYYYSQDNIAESSLAFRTAVTHPQGYNLSFYDISKRTWGFTLYVKIHEINLHALRYHPILETNRPTKSSALYRPMKAVA
jgi:hypothetical protein